MLAICVTCMSCDFALQYHAISETYYKGLHAVVAVYDVTDARSFEKMKGWVEEVQTCISKEVPLWIVGNKVDASYLRQVGDELVCIVVAIYGPHLCANVKSDQSTCTGPYTYSLYIP